jgi:endonuclease YncB( thermonuclease family)
MRVRLLRSWTSPQGRKYPIGQVITFWRGFAKEMIQQGLAVEYTGDYPNVKKEKTEFFKPK